MYVKNYVTINVKGCTGILFDYYTTTTTTTTTTAAAATITTRV